MIIKIVESDNELQQAYKVRMEVFVNEQKVPEEIEIDEHEDAATHFIGYEGAKPIAASRLRFVEEYGKLERICILKDYRGKSHGMEIINAMESVIIDKGYKQAKLNAQTQAEGFYQKLGYDTVSGDFLDAGIPHVTMIKQL
ncbi:GNAT family N-acetyltransferase [Oceanobacillus zhaokaii]|uniref:GNAT family N-acetyltransferase n=1 Tax=Oceanobacillus zhaokaii TaxID=2052660 RepID=A0A345PFM8_9BACI|nr:GNAT family N-acetyltransferase [Oceanobacillus zhaokaii]AXI08808.1 GNAT family N-acetyltransferase [Oceanobacillus zhaokaii]